METRMNHGDVPVNSSVWEHKSMLFFFLMGNLGKATE